MFVDQRPEAEFIEFRFQTSIIPMPTEHGHDGISNCPAPAGPLAASCPHIALDEYTPGADPSESFDLVQVFVVSFCP